MVYAGGNFGQREHLFLVLTLPYAFGAAGEFAGRRQSRGLAIVSGLMAGVGFAIKPFLVIPLVMVELVLARRRSWKVWMRPEAMTIASVYAAYLVVLVAWTPQYFEIARRFAPLYPHYGPRGPMLLASSWRLAPLVASIAVAWYAAKGREAGWVQVFGGLAVGSAVAVYLNGKGWPYHWFPAVAIAISLFTGAAAIIIARQPGPIGRIGGFVGLMVVVPAFSAVSLIESRSEVWEGAETIRFVRDHTRPGDVVLVLTPWVHTSFPMINQAGVNWGMRHPMLWQISAFYDREPWKEGRYHAPGEMSDAERRFVGEIAADFGARKPTLVLVDSDPPLPALENFDYLAYFAQSPEFSREMTHYEPCGVTGQFRAYRRSAPAPPTALGDRRVMLGGHQPD